MNECPPRADSLVGEVDVNQTHDSFRQSQPSVHQSPVPPSFHRASAFPAPPCTALLLHWGDSVVKFNPLPQYLKTCVYRTLGGVVQGSFLKMGEEMFMV